MKSFLFTVLSVLASFQILAQSKICGHVECKNDGDKLIGASVFWEGTTTGSATDANGEFCLPEPPSYPARLVASYVGYKTDTLSVASYTKAEIHVHLSESIELQTVNIEANEKSSSYELINPILTENLGSRELKKAACCNLSESFETNASVDVVMTDAVSGARKIRMLGLDGIYTQIQAENIPLIRGLSSGYGMMMIPGTWIESIQVGKGPGSVVNGYESMTGQINLEYQKPDEADQYFINLYGNFGGRLEANLQYAKQINESVGTTLFVHGSARVRENDMNNDGFMDMPKTQQYGFFNRWKFKSENWRGQIGVRGSWDHRVGGQLGFRSGESAVGPLYGIEVLNRQADLLTKTAYLFPGHGDMSMALLTNWRFHDIDSEFGSKHYQATQRSINANLIWQNKWRSDKHGLRAGGSFTHDSHSEFLNDSAFGIIEYIPGAFAEYSLNADDKFTAVAGFRADWHNTYNWLLTPRLHLKYSINELTSFRVSGGRGYRTARVFADNAGILANSRKIVSTAMTTPEESWNYGASFSHTGRVFRREFNFTASYFRTEFINQMVIDFDQSARELNLYPLAGRSFSNAFQTDLSYEPLRRFEIKLAYKLTDVHMQLNSGMMQKPLVDMHLIMLNLGYATKGDKWMFDYTVNLHGPARIPGTSENPAQYQLDEFSPWHVTMNAQVTKKFKWIELYVGVENATNFVQRGAIVASNDPQGEYFDASMIWGPTMGINPYLGLKMRLNPKDKK